MNKVLAITSSAIVLALTTTSYAKTCNSKIKQTRPDSRYQDMGAEVKDTVTGLIWQRCSVGQTWNGTTCTGTATTHTWQQALNVAKNLGNGYRLPNIKELNSLVERQCYYPAINTTIFPNTINGEYWSSSALLNDYSYSTWFINFRDGYNTNASRTYEFYVRAVRSE